MVKLLYWITVIMLLFAINGSWQLSRYDWKKKNICPKLFGIPACYIVFTCFLAAGIAHVANSTLGNQLFFLFVGIPGIIALIGTVIELTGKKICPRTKSGIPMCFISLGICATLIVTKYLSI